MNINEKLVEMEAAVKLAGTAAKRTAETKKELQEASGEEDRESSSEVTSDISDKAALSNQSRIHGLDRTQLQKLLAELPFEEMKEMWTKLLEWTPDLTLPLADNLKQLTDIYNVLLQGILANLEGGEKQSQLACLNDFLTQALKKLSESHIKNLTSLFQDYSADGSLDKIRNTLFSKVTGQTMTKGETRRFFGESRPGRGAETALNSTAMEGKGKGIIYKPSARNVVVTHTDASATYIKNTASEQSAVNYRTEIPRIGKGLYTAADIEKGETFTRQLTGQGNLFSMKELDSVNSELLGTIAAITEVKAQIFAEVSGVGNEMGASVKSAVERMVDFYISKSIRNEEQRVSCRLEMPEADQGTLGYKSLLSKKDVYTVCYYILSEYQRKRSPEEALKSGLKYAYGIFEFKKKEDGEKNRADYPEKLGFFFQKERNEAVKERKKGCRLLEKNWMDFLESIQQDGSRELSLENLEQSFWGMAAVPPMIPYNKSPGAFIAVVAGIVITAIIIAAVWF